MVWEGVSQYLTGDAVCRVMRWAGRLAKGSRFIFTYVHEGRARRHRRIRGRVQGHRKGQRIGRALALRLAARRTPAFLRERGLKLVSDLDANEYREKVMGTAGRHMQGYGFYHTVLAEVSDA
mgnify:CR=1 FL=1